MSPKDMLIEKVGNFLKRPSTYVGAGGVGLGGLVAADAYRARGLEKARQTVFNDPDKVNSDEYLKAKGHSRTKDSKEISAALKEQGLGRFRRAAAGTIINAQLQQGNAMAIPRKKGSMIVAGDEVPKAMLEHEMGHVKDFEEMRRQGKDPIQELKGSALRRIGRMYRKKTYKKDILDMEGRAWDHAGYPESDKRRKAALEGYEKGFHANRAVLNAAPTAWMLGAAYALRKAGR